MNREFRHSDKCKNGCQDNEYCSDCLKNQLTEITYEEACEKNMFPGDKMEDWERYTIKEIKEMLNLKEQKPSDFNSYGGPGLDNFCRGYNACAEYVTWVLDKTDEDKYFNKSSDENLGDTSGVI